MSAAGPGPAPAPRPAEAELILAPTNSPGTGLAALAAAIIVVVLALALIFDPKLRDDERIIVGLLGALFAGTLATVGVTLLRGHGALLLDSAGRRLGLGVTRGGDTWWLSLDDVQGLGVVPQAAAGRETVERWLLVLSVAERPDVVIAESDDRGAILGIRERLAARLALAELPEDRAPTGPAAYARREERFAVARGAALQGVLAVFGLSLVAVGVISLLEVNREPVVGFIFGPILVVMGVVLLAVPIVKRLASESLSFDGERWSHGFTFARWRWGTRTVKARMPRFRMRLVGMRGGMLELVGDDGVLILAAGATSRSRLDLEAIAALPARFATTATLL